jgi:glycosyltransferase involved in cell wall biosynthesis
VGINAMVLSDPATRGWTRYAANIVRELSLAGVRLTLYSRDPICPSHLAGADPANIRSRVAPPMRYLPWEQSWLPRQATLDQLDILHSPHNFGLPWSSPCPMVLTLHDAIGQAQPLTWRDAIRPGPWRSRFSFWAARARARRIVTISQHSARQIVQTLHVHPDRVSVSHLAAENRFYAGATGQRKAEIRRKYDLPDRYVFYVGGFESRKNVRFLVKAFAEASLPGIVLFLGGGAERDRRDVAAYADSLGAATRTRIAGFIDDDDLPALYAAALCFVYPSRDEGFGLQAVEAMACGCPVLAARATSLPEVVGPQGQTFDLSSTAELTALLNRVASSEPFRQSLAAHSIARAADFSWTKVAADLIAIYSSLRAKPDPSAADIPAIAV